MEGMGNLSANGEMRVMQQRGLKQSRYSSRIAQSPKSALARAWRLTREQRWHLSPWRVCRSATSEEGAVRGLERLELKKKESQFVQLVKPIFPFIRNWVLIDKCLITLSMLCVIRGLYFMPIFGISPSRLPAEMNLASPEQRMLAEIFMAEDILPLNVALLGIAPIVASSFLMQLLLNVPLFQSFPGPFIGLINKKRMGSLTNSDIEKASFRMALAIGAFMAVQKALALRLFATGINLFFVAVVADLLGALSITRFCCNIVQHHGFGEGTGFLLLSLTLSGFGKKLWLVAQSVQAGTTPLWKLGIVLGFYFMIVAVCTLFNEIQVRLPLTDYSMKPRKGSDLGKNAQGALNKRKSPESIISAPYFPLPIAQTAISALFLSSGGSWLLNSFLKRWPSVYQIAQGAPVQILIFASTAFLIALLPIGQTAANISEYLSGLEVGIKGVIPGDQTLRYLSRKLFESRLLGACCLFFIIVSCMSLDRLCTHWLGTPIGTLNLILLVAVISTAFKTMEAHVDTLKVEEVLKKEKSVVRLLRSTNM